jgi:hypothetical protein
VSLSLSKSLAAAAVVIQPQHLGLAAFYPQYLADSGDFAQQFAGNNYPLNFAGAFVQ